MADDRQVPQLPPGMENFAIFEHFSTRHVAKIPTGVKLDEVCAPAFWAHHSKDLRPWDEIQARAEDGTWFANLVVLDCSRTWARVRLISYHPLTAADVAQSQSAELEVQRVVNEHLVQHRGPRGWSVVRKSDKAVLVEMLGEREKAEEWLSQHAKQTAGVLGGGAVAPQTAEA